MFTAMRNRKERRHQRSRTTGQIGKGSGQPEEQQKEMEGRGGWERWEGRQTKRRIRERNPEEDRVCHQFLSHWKSPQVKAGLVLLLYHQRKESGGFPDGHDGRNHLPTSRGKTS